MCAACQQDSTAASDTAGSTDSWQLPGAFGPLLRVLDLWLRYTQILREFIACFCVFLFVAIAGEAVAASRASILRLIALQ